MKIITNWRSALFAGPNFPASAVLQQFAAQRDRPDQSLAEWLEVNDPAAGSYSADIAVAWAAVALDLLAEAAEEQDVT